MDTKQSKLKPSAQLIQQLKSEGLYLTQEKRIKLPLCMAPPPSIITRLMSFISSNQKVFDANSPKKIWPLEQNLVLITQCNTLSSFTIEKTVTQCLSIKQGQKFHMQSTISQLILAHHQNLSDLQTLSFILLYENSTLMSLFSIKIKTNKQITLLHQIHTKDPIFSIQFISKHEFLAVSHKLNIFRYKIDRNSIQLINKIDEQIIEVKRQQIVLFVKLLARPRQQQESLIAVFYATQNLQNHKFQLNVKEMCRQLDGNIFIKSPIYQLLSFTSIQHLDKGKKDNSKKGPSNPPRQSNFYNREHLKESQIVNQKQYFLLKLHHQIFIITKHFEKYVRLDAITQNFSSFKMLMIEHHVPLICCIGQQSMQLWHIGVQSKKANCTLMDVITLQPDKKLKQNMFMRFWILNLSGKIQTVFAFDRGGRQIGFFGVKRIDKVSKLVNRIVNNNNKNEILKAQQLGKKLGVDRKSLYLKLWQDNPKTPGNIYLYLLQSYDLPSIHCQLQKYMRKKFISTGELIKIHSEIENILLTKLQTQLSLKNLKWYLKTNFQKRKLKLYSFNTQITFKQFHQIYSSSIFDLLIQNIDNHLHPEKLIPKIPWEQKPVRKPNINVYHILQEFKLLILQNYEEFLLKLLQKYKYQSVKFFQSFPDFLPRFPFKLQVIVKELSQTNSQMAVSKDMYGTRIPYQIEQTSPAKQGNKDSKQDGLYKDTKQQSDRKVSKIKQVREQISVSATLIQSSNSSSQKIWFSEITEQEWLRQKSSIDHIFTILYPHYQTHQIMSLISQLLQSQWNKKNLYNRHCLISSTVNSFRQKISKIEGIKLYLSVCQFINRVRFQAEAKLQGQNITKLVLKSLCSEFQALKNIKVNEESQIFETTNENLRNNVPSQAPKLLEIMNHKKLLTGDGYQTCLLYSKMHQLMLSKEIVKKETTILQLMTTSHASLIASFFIGQRQRNVELFKDLLPIYSNKLLFYDALSQYINSSSCSRVQLQILVNELKDLNLQNQEQNNYLAELLIHGFCLRTQIRQKHQAHQIIVMFQQIQLKLDLALKLQKFIAIKDQLLYIFQYFMCEKLTYEEVLSEPRKVLRMILQNYFNNNLNDEVLKKVSSGEFKIEDKIIQLDIIENTFSVFLYLKEKLYVEMTEMQLCLIYGEVMVQWEQFQVLKTIFYQKQQEIQSEDYFQQKLNPFIYFQQLIAIVLNDIYTKQNIYMNQATITHIQSILGLLQTQSSNPLIIREKTKLQLSKLLQKWGYKIQTVNLQRICIKWQQENRQELIVEIMDNCIEYFDLEALQNLYRLLEATRLGNQVRQVRNKQSIGLAYKLAQKLAIYTSQMYNLGQEKQKLSEEMINKDQEISKIIYFINKNQIQYVAEIGLMAETFLRILIQKYSKEPEDLFNLEKQLKSEYGDLPRGKDDFIRDEFNNRNSYNRVNAPNNSNNFLTVNHPNKVSGNKLHKSFEAGSGSVSSSNPYFMSQKSNDKSYNYSPKSHYNKSVNISRLSMKSKIPQTPFQDPINVLKFDDPSIQQRILNHWLKNQLERKNSFFSDEITCIKPWHTKAKKVVQFFVANWENNSVINEMYRNIFTKDVWKDEDINEIVVNKQLCLKLQKSDRIESLYKSQTDFIWNINLSTETLWNLNIETAKTYINYYVHALKHRANEFYEQLCIKYCKTLYYGYFFLLMSLKYPDSMTKLKGIGYDHIINMQMIYLLETTALRQKGQLQRINFEQMWKAYHIGIKKQIILKLFEIHPETKIPDDIEIKVLERLINQISKEKIIFTLYLKILTTIQNFLSKYVKQERPKLMNELKVLYESKLIEMTHNNSPLLAKKFSQQRRFSNTDMRITLKEIQLAKMQIKEISQSPEREGPGLMKQIADAFEDIKKSQIPEENQQTIKQVMVKKILSRRNLNTSSFFRPKSQKNVSPFESSIILENKKNEYIFNINEIMKDASFGDKINRKNQKNVFNSYNSERLDFDSIMDMKSQENNKDVSSYSEFLEQKENIEEIIAKYKLPYFNLIHPQKITQQLASKDLKYEKVYNLTYPLSEDMITKIKDFSRLLNTYELHVNKNSKYYLEDCIKKMKIGFSQQNILQIIQQLYYEQESILVTLNPKQFQANNIRKSKGLGCQEEKYRKAKFSYILNLIRALGLNKSLVFDKIVSAVQEFQNLVLQDFNGNLSSSSQSKDKLNVLSNEVSYTFKKYLIKIFPLSHLTQEESDGSVQTGIEELFGRAYLSHISTSQEISPKLFKLIVDLIGRVAQSYLIKKQSQNYYSIAKINNYLLCMFLWQISLISPSNFLSNYTKQKFEYIVQSFSKEFIIEIHEPTQELLKGHSEFVALFSINILNLLNSSSVKQ